MRRELARRIALAFLGVVASGCLVTSTQEFSEPAPTPPYLSAGDASPPLGRLIVVRDPRRPITFSTLVQSEDAGREVEAHLVADDVAAVPPNILAVAFAPAGRLNQRGRLLSVTWNPLSPSPTLGARLERGCHPITLLASHGFNYGSNRPVSADDRDFLVWWVLVGDRSDPTYVDTVLATGGCPTEAR
ncbi:MAG: hypothetical protein IT374_23545 [Polyangiaceae bacterium]|nr:hypothetical protein [Polyangiaceae bacterium]